MSGFDKVVADATIRIERELSVKIQESEIALIRENSDLKQQLHDANDKLRETEKKLEEATSKIESLDDSKNTAMAMLPAMVPLLKDKIEKATEQNLLSMPLEELAQRNPIFAKKHRAQQEMLADWMVSQKAFKELAIRFGKEKGMTKDEVIDQGIALGEDVLNDANDPEHNTNATTKDGFIVPHIPALKGKLESVQIQDAVKAGRLADLVSADFKLWRKAFKAWLPLAEQGQPKAQYNVGRCYGRGEGVAKDLGQALHWYMQAANQGDPRALYNLHLLYSNKDFPERDAAKAEEYLQRASALGEPRAQQDLKTRAEEEAWKAQEEARKDQEEAQEEARKAQLRAEEEAIQQEALRKEAEAAAARVKDALQLSIQNSLRDNNLDRARELAKKAIDKKYEWAEAAAVAANLEIADKFNCTMVDVIVGLFPRTKTKTLGWGGVTRLLSADIQVTNPTPYRTRVKLDGLGVDQFLEPGSTTTLKCSHKNEKYVQLARLQMVAPSGACFYVKLPSTLELDPAV